MAKHIKPADHFDESELITAQKACGLDHMKKTRIRAIINILKGKTRRFVAETLCVTPRTITNWIQAYNEKGLGGLDTNLGGRKEGNPKWDASIFSDLCKEIDKGGYWSIPRMQEWLKTHKNKDIPEQTVWYRMNQLKYSYKSSRPHPVQANKEKQESFKKGVSFRSWSR